MSSIIISENIAEYGTIPCDGIDNNSELTKVSDNCDEECMKKDEGIYTAPPFLQTCTIILSLSGVAFCSSVSTGLLTVCLPAIAKDLSLPEHLLLW